MPARDPLGPLRRIDARYRRQQAALDATFEERRQAIVDAYRAGISLTRIASVLGLTHEAVRLVVRAAEAADV